MRFTRKTIMALSVSGALTLVAGVSASAAVLGLPILGFGEAASGQAAPQVVHKTVYDDHYVTATTAPKVATPAAARSGASGTVTASGPAPAASVAAPAASPAPDAPYDDDDGESAAPPGAAIPSPPAGCVEPEWDREHSYWKCQADHEGDSDDD